MSAVFTKAGDVAAELSARLERIEIANDFETDIGLRVRRGKLSIPAPEEIPCIRLVEGDDNVVEQLGRQTVFKLEQQYVLLAFDACDAENPNDKAHAMVRDLKRAVFGDGAALGGKVVKVAYVGRDLAPRKDGSNTVSVAVHIRVTFVEDVSKP